MGKKRLPSEVDIKTLMNSADKDGDGKLSKEEVF